jgi:hypothetical protein
MSALQLFIEQCCKDVSIQKCTTSNGVRQIIYEFVYPVYQGNTSVEKINSVIDDITRGVCIKLNIPQE